MFCSVIRFMCGQRLQGLTNSVVGASAATFELIEHSVTSTTLAGLWVFTQLIMPDVEPAKSAALRTSGGHSGWAMILRPGSAARNASSSSAVNRSWTSQCPFHVMISTLVCVWTYLARYSSGIMMTRGTPRLSMTFTAFAEVQQMSLSAFTSADVLT